MRYSRVYLKNFQRGDASKKAGLARAQKLILSLKLQLQVPAQDIRHIG